MKKLILLLLFIPIFAFSQKVEKPFYKQNDKQAHFFAGAVIAQSTYHFVYKHTEDKKTATICAMVMPIAVGLTKELIDSRKGGSGFNKQDLLATTLGVSIVIPIRIFGL